jgi:glutamate carboxypeptidase
VADAAPDILAHATGHAEELAALVADLVRLESPSLDPAAQQPILDRLERELEGVGLRVRRLRGRLSGGQVLALPPERPRGAPAQLLLGHCDTVWPLGMLAQMPVERRDGRLSGPGVYDMKAGLAQGIFALRALRDLGLAPALPPVFFINSDEEIHSQDSARRLIRLGRSVERVFVLEPSLGPRGSLKTRRKGALRFLVHIHGRAAHSGLEPEKGASAVRELAAVIQQLYALEDPARGVTVNVGVVEGGVRGNVVAPEARADVVVRVLAQGDAHAVESRVRALTPTVAGTRIEVEGGIERPPLEATPGNRVLWEAARRCAARLGLELEEGTAGGASDGSLISPFTPTLDGLGAVGDGAHAAHEHIDVARSAERVALLALLLLEPSLAAERPPSYPPPGSNPPPPRGEGLR